MKTLIKTRNELQRAGRWDIDFHLPAEGIRNFPPELLRRVDQLADMPKDHRDPTKNPEQVFLYIDISSIDVTRGVISNPQEVEGADAPSRARKVVSAFDIVISTCRPTRGAIAVVPPKLHNQVASTGFSIVRARGGVNPYYLFYALRLPSTLEQFRKWSTGSSYPAILDSDVKKTLIPVPDSPTQDAIAAKVVAAMREHDRLIRSANGELSLTLGAITASLAGKDLGPAEAPGVEEEDTTGITVAEILAVLRDLPELSVDSNGWRSNSATQLLLTEVD